MACFCIHGYGSALWPVSAMALEDSNLEASPVPRLHVTGGATHSQQPSGSTARAAGEAGAAASCDDARAVVSGPALCQAVAHAAGVHCLLPFAARL